MKILILAICLLAGNALAGFQKQLIAGGDTHALIIKGGMVVSAGRNNQNQLGDGLGNNTDIFQEMEHSDPNSGTGQMYWHTWLFISAGYESSMGILDDSTLWAWGSGFGSTPGQFGSDHWLAVTQSRAAGKDGILAIRADSTLWAWGQNSDGYLGIGGAASASSPTQVGSSKWLSVSTMDRHTLGIRADSTLWAWGTGYIGDTAVTTETTPIRIGTDKWIFARAGSNLSAAIRADKTLWTWGDNSQGALGMGDKVTRPALSQIAGQWRKVEINSNRTMVGLKVDGSLWSWGSGVALGQFSAPESLSPGRVGGPGGSSSWKDIGAGNSFFIALDAYGDYSSWGECQGYGYLGNHYIIDLPGPTRIHFDVHQFLINETGNFLTQDPFDGKTDWSPDFSPARSTSGLPVTYTSSNPSVATINEFNGMIHIVGAGGCMLSVSQGDANNQGQGFYPAITRNVSFTVNYGNKPASARQDSKVSAGFGHAAVIKAGTLSMTGKNDNGELGIGTNVESNTFRLVSSGWRHVSCGVKTSLALKDDSTLWVWGDGQGYPGFGEFTSYYTPRQVGGAKWLTVSANSMNTGGAGIQADETLWAWGLNSFSELGDGNPYEPGQERQEPFQVGTSRWLDVSVGTSHGLGIQSDSSLWSWGINDYGQMGAGVDSLASSFPVKIGTSKWLLVAATGNGNRGSSLALRSDSTLWGWGDNSGGVLGFPDNGPVYEPVQVGTEKWTSIHIAATSAGGVRKDGTLWMWGKNDVNQLGLGAGLTGSTRPPTRVGSSLWKDFAIGESFGMGLDSSWRFNGWGKNTYGNLGIGNKVDQPSPTVTVPIGSWQKFTFASVPVKRLNDADFSLVASAVSGLPVTFTSSNTSVAAVSGALVHIVGVGTSLLNVHQAGNDTLGYGDSARILTVTRVPQTLTFNTLPAKKYGDPDFLPGATASSSLEVSYTSSDTTVATIVSGNIHIIKVGTANITAKQAGNSTYAAAPDSSLTLTVGKLAQTLAFAPLSAKTFGDADYAPVATSSSLLAASYSSSNSSVAIIIANQIHIVGAGTTNITASQAGNANFNPAVDSIKILTVGKSSQTLSFPPLAEKVFGDSDYVPGAASSSSLEVTYASSNPAVANITSGKIHIVGAGTTNITASQAGDANYHPAVDSVRSLSVAKLNQTLNFAALPARTFGDADFAPGAVAGSSLVVSYTSSNPAVASIISGKIHIIGAGVTSITASQAGNSSYQAAPDSVQSLTVDKAGQSLTFPFLAGKALGDSDYPPGGTSSSSLAVTYASSNPAVATILANKIHIVGVGTTTVTASQAGNSDFNPAVDAVRSLGVGKLNQSLAFPSLASHTFGDSDFTPPAASSSGLPIAYSSSNSAVAVILSGKVHIIGAGTTTVTAFLAGDATYNAAPDSSRTLAVTQAAQTLAFPPIPSKTLSDTDCAPGAVASSNLPVAYTSSDTAIAAILNGKIHIVGAGSALITARQAGNANYLPAADSVQTLAVNKLGQSLTFTALAPVTFGVADFAPGAAASSALAPTYASSDTTVATIAGGLIHILGSGSTVITASQIGNAVYFPATDVTQSLSISKAAQSLVFEMGADSLKTEGDAAYKLNATSNAGLTVSFLSSDTSIAAVSGDSVLIGHAGTVFLTALQAGNLRYTAAPSLIRTLRIQSAIPAAFTQEELEPRQEKIMDTAAVLSFPRRAKATGYHLQASLDPDASHPMLDTVLTDTAFLFHGLAFGSKVSWRVAAFNATGQAPYSPYAVFLARPKPPQPLDVSRIPVQAKDDMGTTVELTWPKADIGTGYHIQVSLDTSKAPQMDTVVTNPSYTLVGLPLGSRSYWRITPVNGPSEAPFTPWLTFKVRDKDDGSITRGVDVDSIKPVQISKLIGVASKDSTRGGVQVFVTEAKLAPLNLPPGFMPLTGSINLTARIGTNQVNDSQVTITLTPPDTALNGTAIDSGNQPLVYLLDSATGQLEVLYNLPHDSLGRIILPLSKGRSFILAVDTVPPVLTDATPPESQKAGSNPVISGVVQDNIRNCKTMLHFRKGGEEAFDSVAVTFDASGHFEIPLSLQLDNNGFEYNLTATDGRNLKATPHTDIPVDVKALQAADSLPSMQWRLFALPTLPNETRWADMVSSLGLYGQDWKLFERAPNGLREFGTDHQNAEAGTAYWLKSRHHGFLPSISGGVATPVNKPFEIILPPKAWRSFGNPFLFPVAWQNILDSSHAPAGALQGPYTYRDTAWLAPLEIPALLPWEGYYVFNATNDTLRLRIPSLKAKATTPFLAQTAFNLQWQVRGDEGKDAGNFFGGLPVQASTVKPPVLAKRASMGSASAQVTPALASNLTSLWQSPKPESPEAGLRAGFFSGGSAAGLLQTDFRSLANNGGLTWTARLSGLKAGNTYANRFQGIDGLPQGMRVALADPATGAFVPWTADKEYLVETQAGEESRELQFFAGSPEYVRSRGAAFLSAHPIAIDLGNYPNPVRAFTVVKFAVPASAAASRKVKLSIFDMQGRLVKLLAAEAMTPGWHSLRWDARNQVGQPVAAGVYRLLLEAGDKKMNRSLQILP